MGIYSEKEFDLSRIKKLDGELLELGGMPNRREIVSRFNPTYTLLLRSILNIKITVGGDEGQIERTVPLAAPLRSRSVIVPTTVVYKSLDDAPVSPANRESLFGMATWITYRTSGSC